MSYRNLYLLAFALCIGAVQPEAAWAQFENKPMAIGSLSHIYSETGGQQEYWNNDINGLRWPAIYRAGSFRADALWIAAQNVPDPAGGQPYDVRVAHVGPRVTGAGEFFPFEFTTLSKFAPPVVTVDGFETFEYFPDNDAVVSQLAADRVIVSKANTLTGVTLTKRVYAFSQGYNDNYHIQEYVLTNTGNTDEDPEQEFNQTLEGVYLHFQKRYTISNRIEAHGSGWGANVMNDIIGDGIHDSDPDFRAQYTWLGNFPGYDVDPLGSPQWSQNHDWAQQGDSIGRLSSPQFLGTVTLHADTSPSDRTDDVSQPSTTGSIDADYYLTSSNDAYNRSRMLEEYDMISAGYGYMPGQSEPTHHAHVIDPDGDFTEPDGNPMFGRPGGWTSMFSYGPYTLAPGDSVRIVMAEAVDGLNLQEAARVGQAFKQLAGHNETNATTELANTPNIELPSRPGVELGKNDWWWSGRDSLFATFEDAIDVYEASNGLETYVVPEPPQPPATFSVESGVGEISLSWTYEGAAPAGGFEIYRSRDHLEGEIENLFEYDLIATLPADARSYADTDVQRGIDYYYYIQAVGTPNTDPTAGTPVGVPLKSSRYWTQTYDAASSLKEPGATTDAFQIVPNPFNIASDEEVRWTDRRDKLGFLDIPGNCTIRIYTERGDLIRTIEHTTGSGDEYWDMTTESQQLVVSGLYIAVVDNLDTGERVMKKFVVIR